MIRTLLGVNLSSPQISEGVRVTRSLVLCLIDRCVSFCTFSFYHCVVCSSIYGFWLTLWYLQTLLGVHVFNLLIIFTVFLNKVKGFLHSKTIILVTSVQQTHSKNNLLFQNIGNVINNIYNYSNIIMHKTVHQNNYIIQRKCFFLNLWSF
jgi:hypothetical protein